MRYGRLSNWQNFSKVKLDHLYLIGIDCPGTFEVTDYEDGAGGKGGEPLPNQSCSKVWRRVKFPSPWVWFSAPLVRCVNTLCLKRILFLNCLVSKADQEIGIEIGDQLGREIEEKGVLSFSDKRAGVKE